jgi:flagellar biosynthesis/type III secretory pathway protein FliH
MFVVFYNGRRDIPDKITMKLSEQMAVKVEEPSMELTVTAYNINSGRNIELMESCKPLSQYSEFIFRMRSALAGKKTNPEKSDAIRHVIEECINDNIMSQFLSEHREAVMKASLVEYNEQDEREGILLDGIDKGREEQRIEDEKIIAEMNTTIKQTKTELAETKELVKELEAQLAALKS